MRGFGAGLAMIVATTSLASADRRRDASATERHGTTERSSATDTRVMAAKAPDAPRSAEQNMLLQERWQDVPARHRLKLSAQITDELTELGNLLGTHMNVLSDDMVGLKFDGRKRRAKLRLGTGEGYLRFKFDSDWHFTQGKARVRARVDLGLGDHNFHLELPDVEMVPASYRGDRGVEVRLPLFERRW